MRSSRWPWASVHTARGGRDSIDHPKGARDDVANAVAGALVLAGEKGSIKGWDDDIRYEHNLAYA